MSEGQNVNDLGNGTLSSLRAEYVELCRERGLEPSAHREYDEVLAKLAEVANVQDNPNLAVYARTTLIAIGYLGKLKIERKTFTEHPKLPIAYGARLAGYVEFIAGTLIGSDFSPDKAVYFDELPINSFNGRAFLSRRHGGYFCMLDHGLFRLLHHICLAAALVSNPRSHLESEKPYQKDSGLISAAASIVKKTMAAYLLDGIHPLVGSSDYSLDEGGILLASELSFSMKTFVVAHELHMFAWVTLSNLLWIHRLTNAVKWNSKPIC